MVFIDKVQSEDKVQSYKLERWRGKRVWNNQESRLCKVICRLTTWEWEMHEGGKLEKQKEKRRKIV